ncbi:MAG: NAD(P)/FAD-dependent oxidoreductase [Campylobacterota bacterium]
MLNSCYHGKCVADGQESTTRPRVVIVGGGYGGLKAVARLADKEVDIVLIDQNGYHYLQTEAYDFIGNNCSIADMSIDLQAYCKGVGDNVAFVFDQVVGYEHETNRVVTKNDSFGYDYLIIATGAQTNFPGFIPGLKENSNGVKTLIRALEFKQRFEKTVYEYITKEDCSVKEFNIVVGGAGLSGVEIAAQMAYILRQYLSLIGMGCERFSITLIDAAPSILPEMDTRVIEDTGRRLKKLGIEVKTDSFIQSVDQNSLQLKSGETIEFDFMIFTGGIRAMSFEDGKEKNRFGQYEVDEYFRIGGSRNVFAIGDVAHIRDENGDVSPTAQSAEQAGLFCAGNILRSIRGRKMKKRVPRIYGYFIALGGKYAVGTLFGRVVIKGYSAHLLKRFITRFYMGILQRSVKRGKKKL